MLNELIAARLDVGLGYWRDKAGHEVDFVLGQPGQPPVAIECKWSAGAFEVRNLRAFRNRYPAGSNFVVVPGLPQPYRQRMGALEIQFESLESLIQRLHGLP